MIDWTLTGSAKKARRFSGNLWLPSASVLTAPQLLRLGLADDMTVLRVRSYRSARAPGDVPEVAEQRGFVTFLDLRVQLRGASDGIDEVLEMHLITSGPVAFPNLLSSGIKNSVSAAADLQR